MKLYGHPLSPCTRKILLLAREKATTLDLQTVDLLRAEHQAANYRELHPFGRVPVLEDENFKLFESRAILRYLDARLPGPTLTPIDLRQRALMEQWLSADQSYVAPHTRTLAVENVMRRGAGQPSDAASVANAREQLGQAFDVFDGVLARQPYLVGSELTLADVSLLPYLGALRLLEAEDLLASRPHLEAYRRRSLARPGYAELFAAGAH